MDKILMSECPWCGEVFIKEKIDTPHGCPQEKEPQEHIREAMRTMAESVTIYKGHHS